MFQQMHNCFLSFFRQMQSALTIRLCCFGPFFKFCIILFLSVDVFVSYSLSTRYSLFELFWPVSLFSVIRWCKLLRTTVTMMKKCKTKGRNKKRYPLSMMVASHGVLMEKGWPGQPCPAREPALLSWLCSDSIWLLLQVLHHPVHQTHIRPSFMQRRDINKIHQHWRRTYVRVLRSLQWPAVFL